MIEDLLIKRHELDRQIAQVRSERRGKAIEDVRKLMADHGLTDKDLIGSGRTHASAGKKVAPKYKDPNTGKTWTGRGLKPLWLTSALNAGKTLEEMAI